MSGFFCWLKIFVISEDVYMSVVCFLFLFLQRKICLFGSCMKFVCWYEDIRSAMVKNLVEIRLNSVVWRSENGESPVDGLWIILFQESPILPTQTSCIMIREIPLSMTGATFASVVWSQPPFDGSHWILCLETPGRKIRWFFDDRFSMPFIKGLQ